MVVKSILALLVSLMFVACSAQPTASANSRPSWILDPNQAGTVGAVGQCGTHFNGKSMQRKVAITRAIEELAMQGDVTVDSEMSISTEVSGQHVNNRSKSKTYISANGVSVNAYIEEIYYDKKSTILYVWMIKN